MTTGNDHQYGSRCIDDCPRLVFALRLVFFPLSPLPFSFLFFFWLFFLAFLLAFLFGFSFLLAFSFAPPTRTIPTPFPILLICSPPFVWVDAIVYHYGSHLQLCWNIMTTKILSDFGSGTTYFIRNWFVASLKSVLDSC